MKDVLYADFQVQEYKSRIDRIRAGMDRTGLDVLIVTGATNLRYVFGFQSLLQLSGTRSFAGVFVKDDSDESSLFIPRDCVDAPQVWLDNENVFFWDDSKEPPFDDLALDLGKVVERLKRLSLTHRRIGIELRGAEIGMPVCRFDELRSLLSQATLLDASAMLLSLRKIKSAAEIEVLRATAAISLESINAGIRSLRNGITESELARQMQAMMFDKGCDGQGFLSVQFGADGWKRANLPPTDERSLQENEWVYIDGGGRLMGYNADFARTALYGRATDRQRRIHEAVLEARQAMFDAMRPGVPCCEIYRAGAYVLEKRGCPGTSFSFGHGVGLNIHEDPNISLQNVYRFVADKEKDEQKGT